MSNKILFIFEGEKTEKQVADNLTKYFVNSNLNVQCAFCSDIYNLYGRLSDDEDLDTFAILKTIEYNKVILSPYNRNDFAEIYMFFDYDGHIPNANDSVIKDLLLFFNEETDMGKLFLSYPMVESIKHLNDTIDFKELKVKAKENINYKKIVSEQCGNHLKNLTLLTKENWLEIIESHLKKMNFIVNDNYSLPTSIISQVVVFQNQLSKYLEIDSTVAVLSAFPVFLLDYYGIKKTTDLL